MLAALAATPTGPRGNDDPPRAAPAALPAAPAGGRALTNSMLNMVLINAARGYHAHLDRAAVVARVGAANFDALVAAYTADFAARPDVPAAYPLGQWPLRRLPRRPGPGSPPLSARRPGRSDVSARNLVWTTVIQRAALCIHDE